LGSAEEFFKQIQQILKIFKEQSICGKEASTTGGELGPERSFWCLIVHGIDKTPRKLDIKLTVEDNEEN